MTDVVDYFGLPHDESLLLLDIGCGRGAFIAEAQKKVSCIGISEWEEDIAYCRGPGDSESIFYTMPYEKIGFANEWFDYIFTNTISGMKRPAILCEEVRRLLKRSGKWAFLAPRDRLPSDWIVEFAAGGLVTERHKDFGSITLFVGRKP